MTDPRLARLARLAALLRDRDLAALSAATKRLDALDRQIAALSVTGDPQDDPLLAQAAERHARWQDRQRAQAEAARPALLAARDGAEADARRAFARAAVLERLARSQLS